MLDPELSAKLPPPHDEEPASLRSDILDELQDHLDCAVQRERRRLEVRGQPADQFTIWRAVIERFGDPPAVARRLWFDAMKGKLMSQRVMFGAVAVGLLLLVGWMTMLSRTLTSVVDQNQKATQAILERMGREQPVAAPSTSPEWIPVKFTLVQGSVDGPPVVGQEVSLSQNSTQDPQSLGQIIEKTDSTGVVDFGLLPYGSYILSINAKAGGTNETIALRPGRPISKRIVVPDVPKNVPVKFEYAPPDWDAWTWKTAGPPQGEPALLVMYCHTMVNTVDDRRWSSNGDCKAVVVRADGIYPVTSVIQGQPNQYEDEEAAAGERAAPADRRQEAMKNGDCLVKLDSRVDSLALPPGPFSYTAQWVYHEPAVKCDEGQVGFRQIASGLNTKFLLACQEDVQMKQGELPFRTNIEQSPEAPTVLIRIASNHPSTHAGVDYDPMNGFAGAFSIFATRPQGGGTGFF